MNSFTPTSIAVTGSANDQVTKTGETGLTLALTLPTTLATELESCSNAYIKPVSNFEVKSEL